MAIPLPNLDTRTWNDLVEEGRAQIPVSAPTWTDHNIHDPGISLMELMAWIVEASIYTANTVSDRHLRKFLGLAGFPPRGPMPARAVLAARDTSGGLPVPLPRGTLVRRADREGPVLTTVTELTPVGVGLASAYVFDGERWQEVSDQIRDGQPFLAFGDDPSGRGADDEDPALYLGFDLPLPVGREVSLFLKVTGGGTEERGRLQSEQREASEECGPNSWSCKGGEATDVDPSGAPVQVGPGPMAPPSHHAISTVWEWKGPSSWLPVAGDAGKVGDETRGLSLDGPIKLTLPGLIQKHRLPDDLADRYYVRCRLARGRPDASPRIEALVLNAVEALQAFPAFDRIPIAAGALAPPMLPIGAKMALAVRLDANGVVEEVMSGLTGAPDVLVMGYRAPTSSLAGYLESTLVRVGSDDGIRGERGSGRPEQLAKLVGAPILDSSVRIWSVEGSAAPRISEWEVKDDLAAAKALDRWVVLDAETGGLRFGDGVRGAVPPHGATLLATYRETAAGRGNVLERKAWEVSDDIYNQALLGGAAASLSTLQLANFTPLEGGAAAETIGEAALRAAGLLWAHERLVELARTYGSETLDQLPNQQVADRQAPDRAVNALDFERLARVTPGTRIRRTRAWAGMDPRIGCLEAPGTVTVVIVPELPRGRPTPTPGLTRHVRDFLYRRRSIGTRLYVTGPAYVDLDILVAVRALSGADPGAVRERVSSGLRAFLDPLTGGEAALGWPLGRDVHVPELLRIADSVLGVDYVETLQLRADGLDESCGRVCVPPTGLVSVRSVEAEVSIP